MSRAAGLALLLTAALAGPAAAGGLARPNGLSAEGISLGGAFVAVADDATALHFNPSGAAFGTPGLHLGIDLVIAPRSYTPVDAAGTRGPTQKPDLPVFPLPALGVLGKVGERVVVGAGVWNTYGGQLKYPLGMAGVSAIDESQEAVLEVALGGSYKVSPRLAIGAAARFGVGLFKVKATDKPVTSDLHGTGVGLGATLGATWKPNDTWTVGGVWRSALVVNVTGSGTLAIDNGLAVDLEHEQAWPQSASVGFAVAATPAVRVSAQLDWTQWSRWERLDITFPGTESANQTFPLDWSDSYAARAGVQWRSSATFALRGGLYFDGNAVPDRTIERQYLDANKVGLSLGAGLGFGAWHLDLAADIAGGPARTVPDNSADVGDFRDLANIAPGEHQGTVFTFATALMRRL